MAKVIFTNLLTVTLLLCAYIYIHMHITNWFHCCPILIIQYLVKSWQENLIDNMPCCVSEITMADYIVPFPPEKGWSVVSDMGFHTFDRGCSPGEAELFLLVQVTPEGGYTGNFRILLCADMTFSYQVLILLHTSPSLQ